MTIPTEAGIPLVNYPSFRPYSNVQPFTVRDGATYLLQIETLIKWVKDDLVPHIDKEIKELADNWGETAIELITKWEEMSAALIVRVEAAEVEMSAALTEAQAAKAAAEAARDLAEIFASQAEDVQDTAITIILNDEESEFREALNSVYAAKALEATVTSLNTELSELALETSQKFDDYTKTEVLDSFIANELSASSSATRLAADLLYQARATAVVMAADYGVKGDGSNETAKIGAAIAAITGTGNAGIVRLPAGTILTDAINLPNGVSLVGAGVGITKLKHTGNGQAAVVAAGSVTPNVTSIVDPVSPRATSISVVNAAGIVAGDLILLHDSYSYTSTDSNYKSGEMLKVRSVVGNTINIYGAVTGSWAALDKIYTPANSARISKINPRVGVTISDITATGDPTKGTGGIRVDFCDRVRINNVDIYDFGGFGIGINNSRDVIVSNHSIRDLTDDVPNGLAGYGIYVRGACKNVVVLGGAVSRVRHGFTTMGDIYGMPHVVTVTAGTYTETTAAALDTHAAGEGFIFANNMVQGCFQGLTSRAQRVVIQDNVFTETYGSHVMTLSEENLRDYVVKGNTFWGSLGGAALLTARNPVIGLTIVDNILVDAGSDAILLSPGCSSVLIATNKMRNVGRFTTGRYFIKAGNTGTVVPGVSGGWAIIDNTMIQGSGSAARAIDLSSDGVTGATVVENKISGTYTQNTLTGIILAAASLIYGNRWVSQAPPAVTGSRGNNVALANLLVVLHDKGEITNNTTA